MPTLRLTQSVVSGETLRVEAALEDGPRRQIASSRFEFPMTPQDREDLRWYLEDYLEHASDPAPRIAERIETRIAEIGVSLFKALFHANDDMRDLWRSCAIASKTRAWRSSARCASRHCCRGSYCAIRKRTRRCR